MIVAYCMTDKGVLMAVWHVRRMSARSALGREVIAREGAGTADVVAETSQRCQDAI